MGDLPQRERHPHDVLRSKALALAMNHYDPATDPAGWSISDTGSVWTEIVAFPGSTAERRTQVIALGVGRLLLTIPVSSDPELGSTVEDFATLAGAEAYWEGRSNV